ncbi:hypothetical protein JW898_01830 [Candidatus Woesearchaeota archaeon]|nr:hypothetical protein [Candidatus Woesearchaeota archaeon]
MDKKIYELLLEVVSSDIEHLRSSGQCRPFSGRQSDVHDAGFDDAMDLAARIDEPRYLAAAREIVRNAALDGCRIEHYFEAIREKCK